MVRLLEIENIRDIRLATKALMGLPQHWLQPDVVEGVGRVARTARARGVSLAIHTHVNAAQSVTPLVAEATRAMLDAGVRDVRNQGVLMRGVNAERRRPARPVLRAAGRRDDHAVLLLHVRHDPVQRALAGLAGPGPGAAARDHGLPARASRRRGSSATCRSSASAGCTRRTSTTGCAGSAAGRRTTGRRSRPTTPRRCTRTYPYYDPIDTLPDGGPGVVAGAQPAADAGRRQAVASRARPPAELPAEGPATAGSAAVSRQRAGLVRGRQHDRGAGGDVAAARIRASSCSSAPGVDTRTLRM